MAEETTNETPSIEEKSAPIKKKARAKKANAGDVPAFPDMQNLNAATAESDMSPGPVTAGQKKCRCVTKHQRRGTLVPVGKIEYFKEVPEHFEEAE